MSSQKFEFLINNRRFEDKNGRNERRETEKFTPI